MMEGLSLNADLDYFGDIDSKLLASLYFRHIYKRIHTYKFNFLGMITGKHRCLTAGNKVLMANGSWKNIEDIKIGDGVLSPQKDGSVVVSKVMQITNYFCNDVYNVVEAKGKKRVLYTCSGNHNIPLLSYCSKRNDPLPRKRFRKIKEKSAEYLSNIKNAKQSRVITFTTPTIDFKQNNADIDPYCLGLWLGDGSCTTIERKCSKYYIKKNPDKKNKIPKAYVFSITTNDSEIIYQFKQKYNEINSIGAKKGTTAVTLRITTTGLFFKQLKKLQLIGTKAGTKFIPKECLLSTIDFRLKLLAGIIDTDGFINKQSNNIEITTKSVTLANNILDTVHSLGGNGNICEIKKQIKKINFTGTYYTVRFAFNKKILSKLEKHVKVPRKKKRILNHIHIANNTNKNHKNYEPRNISIRCIPDEPKMVYGFILDSESHWFITNNWVVTCNCGKSLTAISMSHVLDPTFEANIRKRVVYFPNDFMTALQEIKKKNIIGGAIVWDEAGVGIPAREWYDTANKSISYVLQVFGRYRPIVYFVTQDVSYIDSQARKLFHGFYEMARRGNECAVARPFDVRYNKRTGKVYYVYSRFNMKNQDAHGIKLILKKINVARPPKELENIYEEHSKIFKDKIVEQMQERAGVSEDKEIDANRMTQEEIVADLVKNKENKAFLSKRSKEDDIIFETNAIRYHYNIPDGLARFIKRRAELEANKIPEDEQILENVPNE